MQRVMAAVWVGSSHPAAACADVSREEEGYPRDADSERLTNSITWGDVTFHYGGQCQISKVTAEPQNHSWATIAGGHDERTLNRGRPCVTKSRQAFRGPLENVERPNCRGREGNQKRSARLGRVVSGCRPKQGFDFEESAF